MQRWTFHIALCLWLAILAGFKLLIRPPMPASVLTIYMVLVTLGIMIFVAANEARFQAFLAPLKAVFEGRAPKLVQALVLAGIPLLVAWGTWLRTAPSYDAPFEARVVHPQPPSAMQLSGKKLNLAGLQNPLRANAADLEKHTAEGKTIYYQNCFYCHGDALAGDGHFANAFTPIPANFRDVGTISMLQETFVFWRVAAGGPGLPKGAPPWLTALTV
ncbi:MAG: hypothetical protein HYU44_14185, partial [Betaproteobacteria bacterium]|nr:hypothetical protein [Betaproteobacteria bacterium]